MLQAVIQRIKKFAGILLILSVVTGFLLPDISFLKPFLRYLLMLMLLVNFIGTDFKAGSIINFRLLLFPLIMWLAFPLLYIFLLRQLIVPEFRDGYFLILITAPAMGAPVIVQLAKGDIPLVTANVGIYNALSPLAYAFLPFLFLRTTNVSIDILRVFLSVSITIFAPLLVSFFLKRSKAIRDYTAKKGGFFNLIILLLLIAIAVNSSKKQILETGFMRVSMIFVAVFATVIALYVLGYLLAGGSRKNRATFPVLLGHKNTVLMILISLSNFSPQTAIPGVLYLLAHHICNGIHIQIQNYARTNLNRGNTNP